ncbi:peptidoglycan DD-metalloendopeptidase family protein [Streptomyces profundus]|nr:peptidoglycan DD-metalloendopeptidase family protein [Streptomyces sp. MA3_2.13]
MYGFPAPHGQHHDRTTTGYPANGGYQAQGYDGQGYGGQGHEAHGYEAQGYGDQGTHGVQGAQGYDGGSYPGQGYDDQGYDGQGYTDAGLAARGYGNDGHGEGAYGGTNGYGYPSDGAPSPDLSAYPDYPGYSDHTDYSGYSGPSSPSGQAARETPQGYAPQEYEAYQGYQQHPEQQGEYGSYQHHRAEPRGEPQDIGGYAHHAEHSAQHPLDGRNDWAGHGDADTFEQPAVEQGQPEVASWADAAPVEHQAATDQAPQPAAEQPMDEPAAESDRCDAVPVDVPEPERPARGGAAGAKPAGRGRRRSPRPRRSALLSVAAPSLAVLGVTAAATAATVSNSQDSTEPPPVAAPDPAEVEQINANEQFDTQLQGLSAAAGDYAERASRTQGRMDLEAQQAAEEQAAVEEAARQEELRPKFFLPVERRGLSSYFGQAGVNWMSTHTGIDFPVSYGTPVMAATDGEVRTQWNYSYGNMIILTAADGTETWYAHLDSTAYQSGWVQAGTVIGYSGNSGKSTGPHLHFEVRPWGGSPIDPLAWLRLQGLEPT